MQDDDPTPVPSSSARSYIERTSSISSSHTSTSTSSESKTATADDINANDTLEPPTKSRFLVYTAGANKKLVGWILKDKDKSGPRLKAVCNLKCHRTPAGSMCTRSQTVQRNLPSQTGRPVGRLAAWLRSHHPDRKDHQEYEPNYEARSRARTDAKAEYDASDINTLNIFELECPKDIGEHSEPED